MQNSPDRDALDFSPIVLLFWKKRLLFAVVIAVAVVAAVVVTKMMTPQYQTFSVVFPTLSNSIEKGIEGVEFGFDVHSERIIQMLESDVIRDSMITRFKLVDHYNIDKSKVDWETDFRKKFYNNFNFVKSKYKSVVIQVKDEDPVLAADMANYLVKLVNIVSRQIIQKNAKEILAVVEKNLNEQMQKVALMTDSITALENSEKARLAGEMVKEISQRNSAIRRMTDSLSNLRLRYGIGDAEEQMKEINNLLEKSRGQYLRDSAGLMVLSQNPGTADTTIGNYRARMEGSKRQVQYYEQQLKKLGGASQSWISLKERVKEENELAMGVRNRYDELLLATKAGFENRNLMRLENDFEFELMQLSVLREQYNKALRNYTDQPSASFPVASARPNYDPVSPVLWVNVLLTVLFAVFATAVTLLIAEKVRQLNSVTRN